MRVFGESSNLDFLRSVAIGAVLFDHCSRVSGYNQFGAIGRGGVLLFFVHTALVLMFSLERLSSRGKFILPFYVQRIFRIYPLCWVCIFAVLVFHIPSGASPYRWIGWQNTAYNLLLIQNFTFAPLVSGPLWSLPYEIQMYVALPFIFLLTRKQWPLIYVALCWLGSAASAVRLNHFYIAHYGPHYDDSLHSPLTWFVPCFLGGVIAYVLSKRSRPVLPFVALPPLLLGVLLLSFYSPFRHADWIGCTGLGVMLPCISELRNDLAKLVCHNLAKYSYGVYLFHAPLLWFWFRYLHHLPLLLSWILFWISLILISLAGYHTIEKPFIDVGRRTARRIASRQAASEVYV